MNATSDADPSGLAEVFDEFMGTLHKGSDAAVFDAFVDLDLTLTQVRVIFGLAMREGEGAAPIGELAECLHVSTATAGRTVDRLVSLGLADRREDPEDRRSKLVSLTDDGRRLADTQREGMRERIRRFAGALPGDVAEGLRDAMVRAIEAAPAHFQAGSACSNETVRT